jgi:hypothetical protein
MEGWIVPALGAIGVPVLIGWLQNAVKKGDAAQQAVLDRLERDVEAIEKTLLSKSDTHQGDALMQEIRNVGSKVEALNTLVLTELGKRPTREEMMALFQSKDRA